MLHMHSLSQLGRGVFFPVSHTLSFLALSLICKIKCQHQVAKPLWATLVARLAINRELSQSAQTLPHCHSLTPLLWISRSLLPCLLLSSLQFTFQAAWSQNQFSNNSSHDFIQLGNFQFGSRVAVRSHIHSPLRSPLSSIHSWCCCCFHPAEGYSGLLRRATPFHSKAANICVEHEKRKNKSVDERMMRMRRSSSWECAQAECVTSSRFILSHSRATALNSASSNEIFKSC